MGWIVSKFALVSTVDSMGVEFPCHCVMLFETEEEAVSAAVAILVKHGEATVAVGGWIMGGETYDDAEELLESWQEGLDISEYFHVLPVQA